MNSVCGLTTRTNIDVTDEFIYKALATLHHAEPGTEVSAQCTALFHFRFKEFLLLEKAFAVIGLT